MVVLLCRLEAFSVLKFRTENIRSRRLGIKIASRGEYITEGPNDV
jgi:hypothetical protein